MRLRFATTRLVLALCAIMLLVPPGAAASGPIEGSVDARNLGNWPLERVIVRWRPAQAPHGAAVRTARLATAVPGVRRAASVSVDTTAYWVPAVSTRAAGLATLHALAAVDGVAEVAPDVRVTADLTPNDPLYADYQWDLFDPYGIDAPAAWDITTGSSGVTVAVIDTGITSHTDLAPNVLSGYDFISDPLVANDGNGRDADASDPGDWVTHAESISGPFQGCTVEDSSWHGTHVAGTIGARGNNGVGVAGIGWTTKILPVRVLGKCGGYLSDIDAAIHWAAGGSVPGVPENAHPARVLNLSLGGPGACDTTTQAAVNDALAHGAVVVVAAGNSEEDLAGYAPASCSGVISVTATATDGTRAWFSNYGAGATIAAPGVDIASTWNTGKTSPATQAYAQMEGTSMATPHVAGVAALALAVDPTLTPSELRTLLVGHTKAFAPDESPSGCAVLGCGAGILDAGAVVAAASDTTPPSVTSFALITSSPTSAASVTFSLAFSEPVSGLAANDLYISGSSSGCSVGAPAGAGKSYTIAVTGCGTGTLALVLHAGAVKDAAGNAGPSSGRTSPTITVDRTTPSAGLPVARLLTNARVGASDLPLKLTWSGTDTGTGVASYTVARTTDGGSTWTVIASGLSSPMMTTRVAKSGTVRFRVRAVDRAGNVSPWSAGPTLRPRLRQQGSRTVHYRGTWRKSVASSYSGGSVKYAKARGARATTSFTGRSIALVTTKALKRGKVRIYVNGKRVETIDLRRSSKLTRVVVWQRTWATAATRTIRVVVVGTSGRPRVDVDAFAMLR